jgi:hypothetical protein
MRPKFGSQYRIKWIDAFERQTWTEGKELDKLIEQFEKPADQTDKFYIYVRQARSRKAVYRHPRYLSGWIQSVKAIR